MYFLNFFVLNKNTLFERYPKNTPNYYIKIKLSYLIINVLKTKKNTTLKKVSITLHTFFRKKLPFFNKKNECYWDELITVII